MYVRIVLALALAGCDPELGKPPTFEPDTGGEDLDSGDTGPDTGSDTDTGETAAPADCEVDLPAAGAVDADPACDVGVDAYPFDVEAEGRRLVFYYPRHTPVVGHAEDDDGDGRLGPGDHAELVAVDRYGTSFGSAVSVYGEGYGTVWEQNYGWNGDVDPLFADLDDDGVGEIVLGADGVLDVEMVAVDARTGREKWRSEALDMDCLWANCQTTAADVDGDGIAEVIVDGYVLDGATGAIEATMELPDVVMYYRGPLVADLDLDGKRDIVIGDSRYAPDGTMLWSFDGEARSAFPAPVQLDDDPEAEIALSLDYEVLFLEADGTERFRGAIPGAERYGWAGPPCVGDIDGDGASEVMVPGGELMNAYEADGTVAWSAPMYGNDGTGWYAGTTGCAVFDFDRDGAVEIVFGDAMNLRILDGRTGSTVWETEDYAAYMEMMGPVIADVDADGSAEILAVSTGHVFSGGESWMGLQIYGHPRNAWRTEGQAWGVHDYAVGNQSGGAMADDPVDTWNTPGIFRGQVATPAETTGLPALTVEIADVCEACDADAAHVSAVVGNVGAADAAGAAVELRAVAADGSSRVLARAEIGAVTAGRSAAAVDLAWAPSDVAADEQLVLATVLDGETCAAGGATVEVAPACE